MHTIPRILLVILYLASTWLLFASEELDPAAYLHYPEVRAYVEYFTTGEKKRWLESALARGEAYNEYVSDRIAEFSLPEALKYLPVIESGCNPRAVSPSGAAGLWQFMLNSIEPYDLHVNEWVDERKDFWKSTIASLKKLSYNKAELGDWLLAIAAYNCGINRLKRILEDSSGKDYWELSRDGLLPVETRHYIPKFLAIAHIAENAGKYGITLPAGGEWNWRRIPVKGQINLQLLAERTGIPTKLLTLGNAELNSHVTPPIEYLYHLKVPAVYSDVIDRFLQEEVYRMDRFRLHTIARGDTLSALSGEYGVPIDLILQHNPGVHPRFLQINAKLIIPVTDHEQLMRYQSE